MALLAVDAVEKRFGGLPALGGVTFGVGEGEILAIVGPNGAGKSTLLKTIAGLENVVLGAMFGAGGGVVGEPEAIRRAQEALAFVGLEGRADQPVGNLNLHQQRFLEMAKALAGRPRLLLIDEVMAGLNDVELAKSLQIVSTARDTLGITIIWVEHVMKAVMSLAERVIVLDFGRMLAEGEPEAVMRHPDVINAYLGQGRDA